MAKKRTNGTRKAGARKRTAPDWASKFLEALAISANIRVSCVAAGVGRTTVYARRDSDPAFARAMAEALDDAVDDLEQEARRRALEGTLRPVFHQGEKCGDIREYSDTLMVVLLKAHRPEKYRERQDVRHTGGVHLEVSEVVVRTRAEATAALSAVAEASRLPG